MRLKTVIWVKAYLRRCAAAGVPALVVRHGDDDAGAVFIKINRLDGTAMLFCPAPAGLDGAETERRWVAAEPVAGMGEAQLDDRLGREAAIDPDLWIVEIEDRLGRHFMAEWVEAGTL